MDSESKINEKKDEIYRLRAELDRLELSVEPGPGEPTRSHTADELRHIQELHVREDSAIMDLELLLLRQKPNSQYILHRDWTLM